MKRIFLLSGIFLLCSGCHLGDYIRKWIHQDPTVQKADQMIGTVNDLSLEIKKEHDSLVKYILGAVAGHGLLSGYNHRRLRNVVRSAPGSSRSRSKTVLGERLAGDEL